MWVLVILGCFLLLSCGTEPKEVSVPTLADTIKITGAAPAVVTKDTDSSLELEPPPKAIPAAQVTQRPTGTYRFRLQNEGAKSILHTIAFSPGTFRLQEEYVGKRDSIVVTEGTWAPSAGYIWLYKDQVVRGRYTWKGDTLQYYSPRLKKTFSMNKLSPATTNKIWQTKRDAGVHLYAIGTEPFWSIDVTHEDSIVLNMPDWNAPLRAKLASTSLARDSTLYSSLNDSLQVTVYSLFCSDGMSDFLYTKKVKLVYKGQIYQGCGEVLTRSH